MKSLFQIMLSGLLLLPVVTPAKEKLQSVPHKREVIKTFSVNDGALLSIDNKYGGVNLHTWDNNQIKAVIVIKANGRDENNAKELADQVSIRSSQAGNSVSLATTYQPGNSSFWSKFWGNLSNGNWGKYIRIDYEVYLPKSLANLHVNNSYGDVTANNIPCDFFLNINYVHFYINKVNGNLNLNVNYGEGSLNGITSSNIDANYTDFDIDQVHSLKINSNYSDIKITNAGQLEFHSNYGDISAENISSLTSQSTYGDYKINTLLKHGNIKTTYGDVTIKNLGNQFTGLTISPTYSDISVGIPQNLSVRLDIDLIHGDINTRNISLQQVEKTDEHGKQTLKAVSAGAGANAPLIKIGGSYADVSLSQK